ncbi:penicillin-binding protein 2 [Candidatus Cyanaurora vandensis]|uniref:penicillin-binding protein 2 n=1 Tax=Candidatus Cyanaurora vandensis TaxID=2714958 RepID=UPI002580E56C|nr:penicillin-binding protein 2 [Candidatus Cyanaurora vandensis]
MELQEQRRISGSGPKSLILAVIVLFLLGGLIARLSYLQLWEGPVYRERAEKNRIRPWYRAPVRGELQDRKGRVLASRRQVYALYLEPADNAKADWPRVLTTLSPHVGLSVAEMQKLLDRAGYRSAFPVRIRQDLDPKLITFIKENQAQFPGVEVVVDTVRHYPYGPIAAHIIGYTGEISEKELARRKEAGQNYRPGDLVGKNGVERLFEEELHGEGGGELREVNAAGQKIRDLGKIEPKPGKTITLTLDIELQKVAENALGTRRGAVVVVDVRTGEILVMASHPGFDPNLFSRPITRTEWQAIQGLDHPFLNRAVRPYAPASTFKIVVTAAALESGLYRADTRLGTYGSYRVGSRSFGEHNHRGWGVIGFERALTVSADTFFYQVGLKLGPERIAEMSRRFGFGTRTALELPSESPGLAPDEAWKKRVYRDRWRAGDTANYAIGQGYSLVTPLQNALMMAAIANGGDLVAPRLKKGEPVARRPLGLSPQTLAVIRRGSRGVTLPGGTAYRALGGASQVPNAGKTGTAEDANSSRTNAVFVGYAPFDKPEIAVSVLVEQGGHGGSDAAPIAAQIYGLYFAKKP